jgi:hypothetical protein
MSVHKGQDQGLIFTFFTLHFSFYICCPANMLGQAARVAKLVDALSSGGSIRKDVLVRIQSRAPSNLKKP